MDHQPEPTLKRYFCGVAENTFHAYLGVADPGSDTISILHGTGPRDLERLREAYAAGGFDATVAAYITDIQAAYAGADLVVASPAVPAAATPTAPAFRKSRRCCGVSAG